jgi:hypothetical protein
MRWKTAHGLQIHLVLFAQHAVQVFVCFLRSGFSCRLEGSLPPPLASTGTMFANTYISLQHLI